VISALEYLICEKLMTYAETAVGRPEFARELPRFVAEIRSSFSAEEIRLYLQHLERMAAQEEEALSADPAHDDFIVETPEQRTAGRARLAWLKELLTASVLGTGSRPGEQSAAKRGPVRELRVERKRQSRYPQRRRCGMTPSTATCTLEPTTPEPRQTCAK
jgi:hypothetical protein